MWAPLSNSGRPVGNGEVESAILRALVIGYGSIGQRHSRLLSELGCDVAVMSRRTVAFQPLYSDMPTALIQWQPDYVVVANTTGEHEETLAALIGHGFQGLLLVEKPLFMHKADIPDHIPARTAVAYNLRFHPVLLKLKTLLSGAGNLFTATVYVGSYLPDWRPETDYRQSYSATQREGGGVLRDLSHELDYVHWLFGPWRRITASGGHVSSLEINSEDAYSLIMETEHCPLVSIHMNYLDRMPRRELVVNTEHLTIRADLIANTLTINGSSKSFHVGRDDTYRAQHHAMLNKQLEGLCSVTEAIETLETIGAAEKASAAKIWIER